MTKLAVRSFRLENFKAVQDSKTVRFTPLTVLIGNNGSGKSSLIEGLETFQAIVESDLDDAMERWRGFEHVWNKAASHSLARDRLAHSNPMRFRVRGTYRDEPYFARMDVNGGPGLNELFIEEEYVTIGRAHVLRRDSTGRQVLRTKRGDLEGHTGPSRVLKGLSSLRQYSVLSVAGWQFLALDPSVMGDPKAQRRSSGPIRLARDGSNIAEYLQSIRDADLAAFNGIVETLQYVLPYVSDLQPTITSELQRTVYLNLKEANFDVPGWLLSTGTLRVLALLEGDGSLAPRRRARTFRGALDVHAQSHRVGCPAAASKGSSENRPDAALPAASTSPISGGSARRADRQSTS